MASRETPARLERIFEERKRAEERVHATKNDELHEIDRLRRQGLSWTRIGRLVERARGRDKVPIEAAKKVGVRIRKRFERALPGTSRPTEVLDHHGAQRVRDATSSQEVNAMPRKHFRRSVVEEETWEEPEEVEEPDADEDVDLAGNDGDEDAGDADLEGC